MWKTVRKSVPSIRFSQDSGLELFVHREPFIPGWDSRGAITHWSISKDPDLISHLPHSSAQSLSLSLRCLFLSLPFHLAFLFVCSHCHCLSDQSGFLSEFPLRSQTHISPFPICNSALIIQHSHIIQTSNIYPTVPPTSNHPQEGQVWRHQTCSSFNLLLPLYLFSLSLYSCFYHFCCSPMSSLLLSPLFSFSPDVGAGPDGSCCPLHFVSVKHQLVSEWVCAQPLRRSCSSSTALGFYSFSWKWGRERFYRLP